MVIKHISLLTFLLVTVTVAGMGIQQRQSNSNKQNSVGSGGYGEYCNKHHPSHRCDTKALLVCSVGICRCLNQEEMIFDVVVGQCVAKAGSKCRYGRDESLADLRNQRIPCVHNAHCGTQGKCQCSSMFYNAFNVTCLPQKSFNVPCHFDQECRQDSSLKCVAGKCQCDPGISTRHQKYDICVGLAGEKPIEGNCIEFSEKRSTSLGTPLSATATPLLTCECQNGYLKNEQKRCLGSFNQACTLESPCQGNFGCIQGTCQCALPEYQIYKVEENKCFSNVHGPCSRSSDCVPEAFCNTNGIYNECQCRHGFIVEASRNCEKSYGMPCRVFPKTDSMSTFMLKKQSTWSQDEELIDECSSHALLQCRNGRCTCTALKTFSIQHNKCVGLVGSICVQNLTQGVEVLDPICVENSECVSSQFSRLGFGLCTCSPEYTVNNERLCVKIEQSTTTQKTTTTTTAKTVAAEESELDGDDHENPDDNLVLPTNSTESVDMNATTDSIDMIEIEFARFLNDTLYGEFNNATFLKIMKAFKDKKIQE